MRLVALRGEVGGDAELSVGLADTESPPLLDGELGALGLGELAAGGGVGAGAAHARMHSVSGREGLIG
jgi:hypothetical protein